MFLTELSLEAAAVPCNETEGAGHPHPGVLAASAGFETRTFSQAFWSGGERVGSLP